MSVDLQTWQQTPAQYHVQDDLRLLDINEVSPGASQSADFLFWKDDHKLIVYDRLCDHNGGKLFLSGSTASCPLHMWKFDVVAGRYDNSIVKKPLLEMTLDDVGLDCIQIPVQRHVLSLLEDDQQRKVSLTYINHACIIVRVENGVSFATDPWILGPAFGNGWYLAHPSREDALDLLKSVDFIYISHNHPDHLHEETLQNLSKDQWFIVPNFSSGSVRRQLQDLNFHNIYEADFANWIHAEDGMTNLMVLKSGDFRDDSGLLLQVGAFSMLLTVDSNNLNFSRLPRDITVLGSQQSAGATGFPLCFGDYSLDEKRKILKRNFHSVMASNKKLIELTRPTAYLPYAGAFESRAKRDAFIASENIKNKVADYRAICAREEVYLLRDAGETDFVFKGEQLLATSTYRGNFMAERSAEEWIAETARGYSSILESEVRNYFAQSNFKSDLNLLLEFTSDDFSKTVCSFFVRFRAGVVPEVAEIEGYDEVLIRDESVRFLNIKAREHEMVRVIRDMRPWEDLSIGFQIQVYREPNTYNADFWYHFSNIYVARK